MLAILANRTYRHLFAAQVIALVGTGLMTVALACSPIRSPATMPAPCSARRSRSRCRLCGVAPLAGDLAGRLPRRAFLVTLDLVRAAVAWHCRSSTRSGRSIC